MTFAAAGWSRRELWNAPNAVSMARLLSGPFIAAWIFSGEWQTAFIALAVSGTQQTESAGPMPDTNTTTYAVGAVAL